MRAAGCVVNDIWDRKLDAQVERTRVRPLASGEISVCQALIFLFGLLMIGFCVLILMNGTTIFITQKDGSFYWVDSIVFPILNHEQEIQGYKSIRIDITDKKHLEGMLNELFSSDDMILK